MQAKSKLYSDKNTPNVEKKHPNVDKKGLPASATRQPKTMKNTRGECRGGQAAPLCNRQQCN